MIGKFIAVLLIVGFIGFSIVQVIAIVRALKNKKKLKSSNKEE